MLKRFRSTLVMLRECVNMSLSNILSNRVRSFLTILGILIGVTAVITLITTVSGVSGSLSSSFSTMGAGTLSVSVSGSDLKSGMSAEDLDALTEMEIIDGVTPSVSLSARIARGGELPIPVVERQPLGGLARSGGFGGDGDADFRCTCIRAILGCESRALWSDFERRCAQGRNPIPFGRSACRRIVVCQRSAINIQIHIGDARSLIVSRILEA